jgi:Cornifin (SPRR) family
VITQGGGLPHGGVDLAAVARDADLLDLLAVRGGVPAEDPVLTMLAALAAEVDDGLSRLFDDLDQADGLDAGNPDLGGLYGIRVGGLEESTDRALAAVPDRPERARRSLGLRAGTVAVVIGATLSVSGVAAAVTGDPLSPYKSFASAVSSVTGGQSHKPLPANAAGVAKLNHHLVGTRAQIAHGDLAGARTTLTALRTELAAADLTDGQRHALEGRIAKLEAALASATATAAASQQQGPKAVPPGSTHEPSTKAHQPSSTKTPEPNNTKAPEPGSTKAPEPDNTPEPNNTKAPVPNNTKAGGGAARTTAAPSVASGGAQPETSATEPAATDDAQTNGANGGSHGKATKR